MTTWENAAADVAREIRDMQIGGYPDPLAAIENFIDGVKDRSIDPRAGLMLVADEALTVYALSMNQPRAVALDGILTTIAEKQADYGPGNILWAGLAGIILRMHDKAERIKNLARRAVPGNEPLADSWLDLVGYAIVGVMLIDGTFELPLARDLHPTESVDPNGLRFRSFDDIEAEVMEDPDMQDAVRQFTMNATAPEYVNRVGNDMYTIDGGGAIEVQRAPDGSHTHVIISDGVGGVLDIMAAAGYINIAAPNGFGLNTERLSVLLCMLLGASEASLDWRNTTVHAEVPRP